MYLILVREDLRLLVKGSLESPSFNGEHAHSIYHLTIASIRKRNANEMAEVAETLMAVENFSQNKSTFELYTLLKSE